MRIRPIYSQVDTATPPSVRAPLDTNSGFAVGLSSLGESIGKTSDIFAEINQRKREMDARANLANLTADARIALSNHRNEMVTAPYDVFDETRQKQLEAIEQEFIQRAGKFSPEVASAWQNVWVDLKSDSIVKTDETKLNKFVQHSVHSILRIGDIALDEAVEAQIAGRTEDVEQIKDFVFSQYDIALTQLKVPGQTVDAWKDSFVAGVAAKAEEARKTAEKAAEKQRLTSAYETIKLLTTVNGKTNYKRAQSLLSDPEYIKSLGLTVEEKRELSNILDSEADRVKIESDNAENQIIDWIQLGISQGTMTESMIEDTSLSGDKKWMWKERLRDHIKSKASNKKSALETSDPATELRIMNRIANADYPSEFEINALVGKVDQNGTPIGLSIARAEHWRGVVKREDFDPGYKEAVDYLKSQISPRKPIIEGESSLESRKFSDAKNAMDRVIDLAKKDGKPIRGKEIVRWAKDNAENYKPKAYEIIEHQIEMAKEKKIEKTAERNPDAANAMVKSSGQKSNAAQDYRDRAISILKNQKDADGNLIYAISGPEGEENIKNAMKQLGWQGDSSEYRWQ